MASKKTRKTKPARAAKIKSFLARTRVPKTLAEIVAAIGATADETKYVASTALRLVEEGHLKRREQGGVWVYRAA